MAKRRKRGTLDPDYRRKGWNKSAFAPKKSDMTMTEFSFGIPFLLWALLVYLPETRSIMLGASTWYWAAGVFLLLGVVIFRITYRLTWRAANKTDTHESDDSQKHGGN